jgi:hypothetical protein
MKRKVKKPTFSVHQYDMDVDIIKSGIWLCFDGTRIIKVTADLKDWKSFRERLEGITYEIEKYLIY